MDMARPGRVHLPRRRAGYNTGMSGARSIVHLVVVGVALAGTGVARAHPIPSSQHDRTIVVRVEEGDAPGQVRVRVNYRLELAEDTARIDIAPFVDDIDIKAVRRSPAGFYGEFTRLIAPILAQNLSVQIDGRPLALVCRDHRHTLKDEKDQVLGHLRCDFIFQALVSPRAGNEHVLKLQEKNFPADLTGVVHLSVRTGDGIRILEKTEPDEALRSRPATERSAADDHKLRTASLRFAIGSAAGSDGTEVPPTSVPSSGPAKGDDHEGLFHLFVSSEHGFLLLMVLSAWIGAVHALTPGHGKTLVAAYLVGQQGTVGHAVVLGLVTTLTHTGAVLLLALLLRYFSDGALASVQAGLGMAMGLLIACLGFWLLLQRLAGRADHVHLGGHHHHHQDGHHHDHHHDPLPPAPAGKVTWWGLIVLGMSGGIIPCWDAIAMLVLAIGANQLALALPMLLAFSAGLASVLVLLGILVVKLRSFAGSRWGNGRIVRALPLVSALLVTAMGIWLCYESLHTGR